MISRITSSLQTYKSMYFQNGFNIVLAEKHSEATDQDTRNGVGKTSLIEIIHFLFGSTIGPDSLFKARELENVVFSCQFSIDNKLWTVSRNTTFNTTVTVVQPEWSSTRQTESADQIPLLDKGHIRDLRIMDWKDILTDTVFQVEVAKDKKYNISARSLFGYIIRRQADGAFRNFGESFAKQNKLDQQMAMLYFLGLDWTIAQTWQSLRDKEKAVSVFQSAINNKNLEGLVSKEEDLRTQVIIERNKLLQLQRNIGNFNILPEYKILESESENIALRLREISDENLNDNIRRTNLEESLELEIVPESEHLQTFIKQVEILFKDSVAERLARVREFHQSVMQNRSDYLKQEMLSLDKRMQRRLGEQTELMRRQGEIIKVLKASGGLDQYDQLQKELARQEAKVEQLDRQYKKAQEINLIKIQCDEERARLAHRLIINYSEQSENVDTAIALYQEISGQLYSESGQLKVGQTQNGPNIDIHITGQRSKGITNMQIFTFDLTMTVLMARRNVGPRFLIHDSHIFDGVDPRQIQSAIKVAKKLCEDNNFQYILCLTSDQLEERDTYSDNIVSPILYDHDESGGLFGIRFG